MRAQGTSKIVLVDQSSHNGREPTMDDLFAFGITSKADLDSAIGEALLEIAPEDLGPTRAADQSQRD